MSSWIPPVPASPESEPVGRPLTFREKVKDIIESSSSDPVAFDRIKRLINERTTQQYFNIPLPFIGRRGY